ncbi:MAG: hypothetical protein ACYDBJ_21925 [Aggregatilineales bacterium]
MAATTPSARRLSGALGAALIGTIGLLARSTPIRAQTVATTPAPNANPITLFHDDFTTEADRWRLLDLGQKASVGYDVSAGTLKVAVGASNYALWSIPDTDLALDQADVRVQADWSRGGSDSQFGLVLNYRNDNDMLVIAASRDGHVRIGHYRTNAWTDVTPAVLVTFDPTQPITIRAMLITIGKTHRLLTFVDDRIAHSIVLSDFKAGKFGFFAQNGANGATALSLHNFIVNGLANSETF